MNKSLWRDKTVLVTGACGSVGKELLRQLSGVRVQKLIGLDNHESSLSALSESYQDNPVVQLYLADIRERDELQRRMRGVDIVLHAAATKDVILCERSPREPVHTNIVGTQNIIDAAFTNQVERVIFTSSDKAVNPTSIMGTSKLMGERLITAANTQRLNDQGPICASTRFGNVLGSSGSVIPRFKKQIEQGGPIRLTDARMTRFVMTLEDAVELVMESVFIAKGGEVFVTKMPVMRIEDLANLMLRRRTESNNDITIIETGSRPGEKLYEELMNDEEVRRTLEMEDFFVVLPALDYLYNAGADTYRRNATPCTGKSYNSSQEKPMRPAELEKYLLENSLIS